MKDTTFRAVITALILTAWFLVAGNILVDAQYRALADQIRLDLVRAHTTEATWALR